MYTLILYLMALKVHNEGVPYFYKFKKENKIETKLRNLIDLF
jgi:hypothetical protein